jgi:putative transposase
LIENTQSNMDAPTDGEQPNLDDNTILGDASLLGEHIGSPLHRVMQWFKTMSTNEYIRGVKNLGWPPFAGKLWQRNYYERIIRNERAYRNIANYIVKNPENWREDNFY